MRDLIEQIDTNDLLEFLCEKLTTYEELCDFKNKIDKNNEPVRIPDGFTKGWKPNPPIFGSTKYAVVLNDGDLSDDYYSAKGNWRTFGKDFIIAYKEI